MNKHEMATLLAKVHLGDNRNVDALVLDYWLDTVGDLEFDVAIDALRRFRRERPGVYLEPGHLLEMAGVSFDPTSTVPDITAAVIADSKRRVLAEAGVTEAEYEDHKTDKAWLLARFPVERRELTVESGEQL